MYVSVYLSRYDICKSSVFKQRQKDDEEGQLQLGISTRQSKGTYYLPCFKDPPEKKGEFLERVTVKCLLLYVSSWTSVHKRENCVSSLSSSRREST